MTLSRNFFMLATAFISMCVAAAAGAVALSETGIGNGPAAVSLVALGVALVCLWRESKSDLDAVLTLVAVSLLLGAICVGIYLFSADHPGLAPKIALGASLLVSAACGFMTYRRQHGSSADFPNVLLTKAPATSVFETEGVQFLGLLARLVSPLSGDRSQRSGGEAGPPLASAGGHESNQGWRDSGLGRRGSAEGGRRTLFHRRTAAGRSLEHALGGAGLREPLAASNRNGAAGSKGLTRGLNSPPTLVLSREICCRRRNARGFGRT